MRVIENFMCVAVDVALGEMKPGAQGHEQAGDHNDRRQRHAKDRRRRQRPDEGSRSVLGTRARRTEMAKRHHIIISQMAKRRRTKHHHRS